MLWTDCAWSVVSKVILDGRIAQYLADLSKKTSKTSKMNETSFANRDCRPRVSVSV